MTTVLSSLQQFAQPWFVFLAEDPTLRLLQFGMLFVGVIGGKDTDGSPAFGELSRVSLTDADEVSFRF